MPILRPVVLFLLLAHQLSAQKISFKKIDIDTSYLFRGLSVVNDKVAWVSGKKGVIGKSTDGGEHWTFTPVKGCEKMDFRTLYAFNAREAVIANAGSPAYIMRTGDGGITWQIVYTNNDSLAFIDGADFWNDKEGIAYGDPINGRMLLLHTTDGGKTWHKLPEQSRPVLASGEASFAASGTGIRCYGKNKLMISTGGSVSRLLVSPDKGKTWKAYATPMMQGMETTGIFSFAFAGNTNGIIVGGDYKRDTLKKNHVFYTRDGGSNWKAPAAPTGGQRECVAFVAENIALASGTGGMDVSYDGGINWRPLEHQKRFTVIKKARKGTLVIAAGYGKISLITIDR